MVGQITSDGTLYLIDSVGLAEVSGAVQSDGSISLTSTTGQVSNETLSLDFGEGFTAELSLVSGSYSGAGIYTAARAEAIVTPDERVYFFYEDSETDLGNITTIVTSTGAFQIDQDSFENPLMSQARFQTAK
ncbi:MAG: hypothetical protein MK080_03550 [Opitutales bacterium]|nr:hypothetical protein [Opitutales bacterium]NRA26767.1 hypothetical protein [Opitutales bacterium]